MSNYFDRYSSKEKNIAYIWTFIIIPQIKNIWSNFNISYKIEKENTAFHDLRVYLDISNFELQTNVTIDFTIEVKEEENYWFCETGNIGLDLLSAFKFKFDEKKNYFKQKNKGWVNIKEQQLFFENIEINKYGKLYTCDADIQLFYCSSKRNNSPILLKAYFNKCLQQNLSYFLSNFSIRINNKDNYESKSDTWESAVILVNPYLDLVLNNCEIKRGEELVSFLQQKFNLNF